LRPLQLIVGLVVAYAAVLVPGILSVYNPHQYEANPLFQPEAIKPVFVVAIVAVAVMWLFARKWSEKTVYIVLGTGLALTALQVTALTLASMQPMRQAGPLLFTTAVLGILAVPCVSVLSVAARGERSEGDGAG
jgi:MFS superfamily sulfate permease-like transporter